jgi:hypothetical protein
MKFQIKIKDLAEAYKNKDPREPVFLCNFIRYAYLPKRSIFHFFYLLLSQPTSTNYITKQFASMLNCKDADTLEEMLADHPDFQNLKFENHKQYRIAVLNRMMEINPEFTLTVNLRII